MKNSRPASVTIISIINFICGGIIIIGSLASIVAIASDPIIEKAQQTFPLLVFLMSALHLTGIASGVLSIISSIGLLGAKYWARATALAFIITLTVYIIFSGVLAIISIDKCIENTKINFVIISAISTAAFLIYPWAMFAFLQSSKWRKFLSSKTERHL